MPLGLAGQGTQYSPIQDGCTQLLAPPYQCRRSSRTVAALVHSGHELGAFMGKHCVTHILAREDGGSSQPPCLQGAAGAAWQSPWAAGWQLASGDVVTGSTAVRGRDGGQPGDALCPDLRLDPTQLGTAAKQSLETCSRCYPCSHLSASDSSQSRKAAPSILLGSIWALLAGTAPDPCSAQSKD